MGNDSDSRAQAGRRGRQSRSSRESSRSAGGLRLFSLKVVEKIRSRVRTTYNAVANELVSDQNLSGGNARDGKSIRRRCYDAINVLLACGLIRKDDRKQIVWRGHGNVELDRLRAEVEKKEQDVEQKKKLLQDMERKHKMLGALLSMDANRQRAEGQDNSGGGGSGGSSSACSSGNSQGGQRYTIPFMLVQAVAGSQVQLHTSDDKTTIQFETTDAPPVLHDDCSVVTQLQQHEAERQANQRCPKHRGGCDGLGPSHATDSGQPTPARVQAAAAGAAGTDLLTCDVPTPEALGKQPQAQPLQQQQEPPPPQQQQQQRQQPLTQQEHGAQQLQAQQHPHRHQIPDVVMGVEDLEAQEQLPPPMPSPPRLHPGYYNHHHHHVQQLHHLPHLNHHPHAHATAAAPVGLPCLPILGQGAGQQELRTEPDFLAHVKPVLTNRTRIWPRLQPPVLPPLGSQAQAQAQTQAPEPQAATALPPPPCATIGLPPPQLPPPQRQLSFSPGAAFSHFYCARSLEQQLQHQQQPTQQQQLQQGCAQPFSARDCFHQHLGSDPLQAHHVAGGSGGGGSGSGSGHSRLHPLIEEDEGFGTLGQDAHHLQHPLMPPPHHQEALPHHHHLHHQPMPHHCPQQPQQDDQAPMTLMHVQAPPAGGAAAAAETSLYSFDETMGEEHLPLPPNLFGSGSDPDPLGFGIGSSSLVADQLGYMGWPFSISPDPFSPSAFLVTPSYNSKGQCRSETNRQLGPLHIGVQQ